MRFPLPAIKFLLFLLAIPWQNAQANGPQELFDAMTAGTISVVAVAESPLILRVEVANRRAQWQQLILCSPMAAVAPNFTGKLQPAADEQPDMIERMKQIRQISTSQVLALGGIDGRGGFGGPRKFALPPGETLVLRVPILVTELHEFRPDADVQYRLLPAERITDDLNLLTLWRELSRAGASHSVAQAAFWHLCDGVPLRQLRLLKHQEINDVEIPLAEHLVSEVLRCAQAPEQSVARVPAKLYLEFINKAGNEVSPLAASMTQLTKSGGFLGLPVESENIESATLQTPAQLATAIGCPITLGGSLQQPSASVILARWDGRMFRVHRQTRTALVANPDPRQALSLLETHILRQVIELRRTTPMDRGSPYGVEIVNHFPLAIRALRLSCEVDATAASREITLTGYAIGPGRRVAVDVEYSPHSLQVIGTAWGR